MELKSGMVIGTYTGVEEKAIENSPSTIRVEASSREVTIPEHVRDLFESA